MQLTWFVVLVLFGTSLVDFLIRKKFSIKRIDPFRYHHDVHKWVERLLIFVVIPLIVIFYFVFPYSEYLALLLFGIIALMMGARTWIEFRYERVSKQYWFYFIWTVSSLVLFVGICYYSFYPLTFAEAVKNLDDFPTEIHLVEVENREQNYDLVAVKRHAIIEDEQKIQGLLISLEELRLRRGFDNRGDFDNFYRIYFNEESDHSITIYDKYVMIETELYKVVGENWLFYMIDEANLDWAIP